MAVLRLVPKSGNPIEITADNVMIGREPTCDVVVSDGSVSRKHAKLEKRPQGWTVVDQGSANGTFLDSQRASEAVLRTGQELRFGAVGFRVEIESDDGVSATMVAAAPEPTVVAPSPIKAPSSAPAVTPPLGSPAPAPPPLPKPKVPPVRTAPPTGAPPPPVPEAPGAAPAKPRVATSAASGPVGQMAPPPAPAKKGRGPLFWMVTGCCGCLLLGVLLAVLGGGAILYSTQAPVSAVQSQLKELKRGDVDGVYQKMADEYRAQVSPEAFAELVARHPGLQNNKDATFWKRNVVNDRATLGGVLTPESGGIETVTFEAVKEGGEWRIASIRFDHDSE
jgi:hypothetical protein